MHDRGTSAEGKFQIVRGRSILYGLANAPANHDEAAGSEMQGKIAGEICANAAGRIRSGIPHATLLGK
jgi:hypothetical protein